MCTLPYYWLGDDSFGAGLIGLNFKNDLIQGQLFHSWNPCDFGLATIAGSGSRQGNVVVSGGWIQVTKDNLTVGTGYSRNSKDAEAGSAFINYKLTYGKYVSLVPEIGYFWGEGIVTSNTIYGGTKIVFALK